MRRTSFASTAIDPELPLDPEMSGNGNIFTSERRLQIGEKIVGRRFANTESGDTDRMRHS
jgi:hypothetical protein